MLNNKVGENTKYFGYERKEGREEGREGGRKERRKEKKEGGRNGKKEERRKKKLSKCFLIWERHHRYRNTRDGL